MLTLMIKAYRRFAAVKVAVRLAVTVHHILTPASRRKRHPCPLAGRCSATGLAEAAASGWGALPGILARMSLCGPTLGGVRKWPDDYSYSTYVIPGLTSDPDCQKTKPCSMLGTDEHCQSWI